MKIDILSKDNVIEYEKFILENINSLFYASNKYRLFLRELLNAEDKYFLAIKDNRIVGVLPTFVIENSKHGAVINSLPFYGSNGAIIENEGNQEVKELLLNAFFSFAQEKDCASATIITSPLEKNIDFYEKMTKYTYKDNRIGQITELPSDSQNINNDLLKMFEEVRRRNIKKAQKENVMIITENNKNSISKLSKIHKENMTKIGGLAKTDKFFKLFPKFFKEGEDYNVFTACVGEQIIAGLLVFYFNNTVEYFTPVVVEQFRNMQGLSLIIFNAMIDAVKKGYKYWNWGGTWTSQEGVYDFKKRWGTQDKEYYYYTKIYNERIKYLTKEEILKEYPLFYVLPFGRLNK